MSVNGNARTTVKDYLENASLDTVCVQEHRGPPIDWRRRNCGVHAEGGMVVGPIPRRTVKNADGQAESGVVVRKHTDSGPILRSKETG